MEGLLLIPKLLTVSQEEDSIIKDLLLYIIVFGFHKIGISLPRKLFIIFSFYVLVCEIVNYSTYKIISYNKKLRQNWSLYQTEKNIKIINEYLEKNEDSNLFSESSNNRLF